MKYINIPVQDYISERDEFINEEVCGENIDVNDPFEVEGMNSFLNKLSERDIHHFKNSLRSAFWRGADFISTNVFNCDCIDDILYGRMDIDIARENEREQLLNKVQ